ncbi:uncharacterized protein LOC115221682 [Argonauta hians]
MSLITDTCLPLTIIILLIYVPESANSQLAFNITTSGRIGAPATLYCSSQEPNQLFANFIHNETTVITIFTNPTGGQQNPNGTSLFKSGPSTIYIYKIPALSCSDRGGYTCRVVSTGASNFPRVSESLEVLGQAATPVLTAPTGSLILDDNATVSCQGNVGNPAQELKLCVGGDGGICATPDTAVKQEDRCIFTQSAQLTFQVTKTTKEATCSVGPSSTMNTRKNWTVDFPIESIMTLPRGDRVTLVRGTNKRYGCHALGSPVPKYMWEFFPQSSANSTIFNMKEIQLDSTQSGVYVCTASNKVGGVSYNKTIRVVVTVVEPPTLPPTPPPTSPPTSPPSSGSSMKSGASTVDTSDNKQKNIIIGVIVPLVIIIIIIIIVILYRRRSKPAEIEEPPEKPRNNLKEVNLKSPKPDLVETTGIDKKLPMYNVGFESGGEDDFGCSIDDKPRSRKPVFIANTNTFDNKLPCV